MKKTLVFSAIAVAVSIGLAIYGKRNRSEPQPDEVLVLQYEQTNEVEYISGTVQLAPTIGTNIAKPGQFQTQTPQ